MIIAKIGEVVADVHISPNSSRVTPGGLAMKALEWLKKNPPPVEPAP